MNIVISELYNKKKKKYERGVVSKDNKNFDS